MELENRELSRSPRSIVPSSWERLPKWKMANDPNPFLIPLVTDQILKYSSFSTRKVCRLISKQWEREATKFLNIRKNPFSVCVSNADLRNEMQQRNGNADCGGDESEEEIQTQQNFLCLPSDSNCLIVPHNIGPNFYPTVCQLLLNFGRQIRFLELRNADWTLPQLREVLYKYVPKLEELILAEDFVLPKIDQNSKGLIEFNPQTNSIRQLPKLKSVKLELQDDNLQNLANLQFLQELFTIAPNVQCVRGSTDPFSQTSSPHTTIFSSLLFRSVAESEALINTRNLSYLDVNVELRNPDIDLIQAANFPLHTFHLKLDVVATSGKVDSLLNSLKGTLRKLKITHRGCIRNSPNLVNLQNLEYFALHGYDTELRGDPRRRDSIILDQALYFVFRFVPLCVFPAFIEGCEALKNLTELRLCTTFYAPKDISNLKSLFPCLKKLRVSFLNDDTLRRICTDYPHLEELGATEGKFSDTSICGVSPLIQEILHNGVTSEVKDERLKELPNITNMKRLRVLELGSTNVTDFGIVNGVACCNQLKELELDCPKITDIALHKIVQNLHLDRLNIKSGEFTDFMVQLTRGRLSRKSFSM